jgi:hypothetical protein
VTFRLSFYGGESASTEENSNTSMRDRRPCMRRKKMKKLIVAVTIILCTFLFLGDAFALTIEFKNDTQEMYIYNFYWIDNPYVYGKMAMAGGELLSDQSNTIQEEYSPGKYYVIWFQRNSTPDDVIIIPFSIEGSIGKIILSPKGIQKLFKL